MLHVNIQLIPNDSPASVQHGHTPIAGNVYHRAKWYMLWCGYELITGLDDVATGSNAVTIGEAAIRARALGTDVGLK